MPAPRSCQDFFQHQSMAALLLPENSLTMALRQRERNWWTERNIPPLCCPCNSKATRLTFGVTKQNPHTKFICFNTTACGQGWGNKETLWRLQHPVRISLVLSSRPYVISIVSYEGLSSFPCAQFHQPNYSFLIQMPQKHPRLRRKLQQRRSNRRHLHSSEAEFWKRAHSHQDILQLVVSFLSLVTFFKLIGSRIYNPGDSSLAVRGGGGDAAAKAAGAILCRQPLSAGGHASPVLLREPSPSKHHRPTREVLCRLQKNTSIRIGSATKPTESEKEKIKQTGGVEMQLQQKKKNVFHH